MDVTVYLTGLAVMTALAVVAWVISVPKRDVSIVDSFWSLMILGGGFTYALSATVSGPRSLMILLLLMLWAVRLSVYLTWRNWGAPEDRRYRQMRQKYSPHFWAKSLSLVFLLQAFIAWLVSMPLWPALTGNASLDVWAWIAAAVVAAGLVFESVADWQMARFKADPANDGNVLDRGLWRYSRHPNYFGEAMIWWGFYGFALGAGAWWTVPAPLLMTWLLLKFSGVALLEKDISERRPAYRAYIERTNAFIPGPPDGRSRESGEREVRS